MARRLSLALVAVCAVAFAGTAAAAAAADASPSSSSSPSSAAAAAPIAASAHPAYGSFLECLAQAPDAFSVVRAQMPRYLTDASAWEQGDLAMTLFVPSDAALTKFWGLDAAEMLKFPIESFRSAFTPFVRYSMLPRAVGPRDMAVGGSEPTAFRRGAEAGARSAAGAGAAALRFVPGKAGGGDVAVRARYSLAPLTGDHWQCGKGWAHGVGSVLLF